MDREIALIHHTLKLIGGPPGELRVSVSTLLEAVGALLDGARMATRFVVEGESLRKGPRPVWLDAACDIDVTALSGGSAVLALEAPSLRDAGVVGALSQRSLFDTQDEELGEKTAIDLFGGILGAVLEGDPETVMADRPLLEACARFARAPGPKYSQLALDGLTGRTTAVVVSPQSASQIELLRDATPHPQAARVRGVLDTISASRSDIVLVLDDGTKISARLDDHDPEALQALFGRQVVASGMARYRPSGQLLLLDVESISAAKASDRMFGRAPVARPELRLSSEETQDETSGVAAFFGIWPGDEGEEELLEALKAIG